MTLIMWTSDSFRCVPALRLRTNLYCNRVGNHYDGSGGLGHLDHVVTSGEGDGFEPRVHLELGQDVLYVTAHGVAADAELCAISSPPAPRARRVRPRTRVG